MQELLNSLFLTLRLNSREANSSQTVHCLTVEIVQKGLQYISSSDFPDADDLVALLVDNSNHMQPEEAQYTIQHVLKAFKSGAVSCLQLLPGLLNLVTSTESAQSRGDKSTINIPLHYSFCEDTLDELQAMCRSWYVKQLH